MEECKMILSSQELKEMIGKDKLVEGFLDLDKQLQQSGFDFTVERIYSLNGKGTIDFDNSERSFPETGEIAFGPSDSIELKPGCYKVRFNESCHIPADVAAIARTRSSLLRMGVTVETAVWDPGFEGKSESLLIVSNPTGIRIKKNARLIQLVFVKLQQPTNRLYEGIHKNIE